MRETPIHSASRDGLGRTVAGLSTKGWTVRRVTITAGAWVKLNLARNRNHLMIQSLRTNVSTVILAPDPDNFSNDPLQDNCGLELLPTNFCEPAFTGNIDVYARVEAGQPDARLAVGEAR